MPGTLCFCGILTAEVALEAELTATRAQLTANEAVLVPRSGSRGNWKLDWSPPIGNMVTICNICRTRISWKLWKLSPPNSS
jgi:hypothetical protein